MDFTSYFPQTAKKINQQLEQFYKQWLKESQAVHPKIEEFVKLCIEANKDGKRLRGMMVDLGFRLSPSEYREEVMKAGAAFEVFQTAILAHDDMMDKSITRRGKPTIFHQLGEDHYAASQTVCLGDVGFFQTFIILSELDFPSERKTVAIRFFARHILATALGQMLDIEFSMKEKSRSEEDALLIAYLKTSTYTFIAPLILGASLGGADKSYLKKLEAFGSPLGVAFQIQDDILGIFGDEKTIGKSVTSDVEEGKNTALITKAYEKADPNQKKILDRYYGQGTITLEHLLLVKQVFIETGALDYAKSMAVQYGDKAKKMIPELTQDSQLQNLLSEMADYIIARNK